MDVSGNDLLLAFVDDIVSLGKFKAELITSTLKLLENSRKVGNQNNENNAKYMIITRKPTTMQNLRIK